MHFATMSRHLSWDDKPRAMSIALAAGAGALSAALLSSVSCLLLAVLGRANVGALAGAAIFERGWMPTFLVAVIWAPLLETLIGQMVPLGVLTWFGVRPSVAIPASAALFSAGHVISGGGVGQAIVTLLGGLCFASIFAANRRRGISRAYALTATAHATNNALMVLLSFGLGH